MGKDNQARSRFCICKLYEGLEQRKDQVMDDTNDIDHQRDLNELDIVWYV